MYKLFLVCISALAYHPNNSAQQAFTSLVRFLTSSAKYPKLYLLTLKVIFVIPSSPVFWKFLFLSKVKSELE